MSIAADTRTHAETRRNALLALARPPCVVRPGNTSADHRAVAAIRARLRDGEVTVRRTAVTSLIRVAAQLRATDGRRARRWVREVKRAILRERDPRERAVLRRRLRSGGR